MFCVLVSTLAAAITTNKLGLQKTLVMFYDFNIVTCGVIYHLTYKNKYKMLEQVASASCNIVIISGRCD